MYNNSITKKLAFVFSIVKWTELSLINHINKFKISFVLSIMASSAESEEQASLKRKKLTRLGSFSSQEVFRAWAKDSLLKPKTIETLIKEHQVDSLPAVLALRSKDIANLGLPIGQARLFHEAVVKLHAEYTYREPFSPATKVDVEVPSYKSMLGEADSSYDHPDGRGDYFRFHNFKTPEMDEYFCDEESDKKLLQNNGDDDDDDEARSGCACERWLFISIFMPFILILSVLGFIAWLLLWPINKCCPIFSRVFNATENLMKLPLISINWAIGRKREHEVTSEELAESVETKKNYGGTEDISMHDRTATNE